MAANCKDNIVMGKSKEVKREGKILFQTDLYKTFKGCRGKVKDDRQRARCCLTEEKDDKENRH